jgi:hypothetical protein
VPSRWIECPVHNTVMRITGVYESMPGSEEFEWIMWRCLEGDCPQLVTEVTPGHKLMVEAFTVPGTIRRYGPNGCPSDVEVERRAARRERGDVKPDDDQLGQDNRT